MSWIRSNRVALLALLLLVPISVTVAVSAGKSDQLAVRPTVRVIADASGTAELGGVDFRITEAIALDESSPRIVDAGFQLPSGAQLVLVTAVAEPAVGGAAVSERILDCEAKLAGSSGGNFAGVIWDSRAASEFQLPSENGAFRDSCDLGEAGPRAVEFSFVTPRAALNEFALELSSLQARPNYAWMPLPKN